MVCGDVWRMHRSVVELVKSNCVNETMNGECYRRRVVGSGRCVYGTGPTRRAPLHTPSTFCRVALTRAQDAAAELELSVRTLLEAAGSC